MKLNQSDRKPFYVFKTHKTHSEKYEKGSSNVLSVYNLQLSIETHIVHEFTQKQENRNFTQNLTILTLNYNLIT